MFDESLYAKDILADELIFPEYYSLIRNEPLKSKKDVDTLLEALDIEIQYKQNFYSVVEPAGAEFVRYADRSSQEFRAVLATPENFRRHGYSHLIKI